MTPSRARPGRSCEGCGAPLSRYNPADVCQICKAGPAAAAEVPPAGDLLAEQRRSAGLNVRRARRSRGLTLEQLAGRIGKSKGWLSMIENGHLALEKRQDIAAITGVLDVPADAIFGQPVPEPFAGKLRELLAGRGMTLGELARRSHFDKGYLSKVVNGRRTPSRQCAERLDKLLGACGELAALVPVPPPVQRGPRPPLSAAEGGELAAAIRELSGQVAALTEALSAAGYHAPGRRAVLHVVRPPDEAGL